MELKDKKSGVFTGTKALGAALVANINPVFNQSSPSSPEHVTTTFNQSDVGRVFSHSDLANLTLHQVRLDYNLVALFVAR